MLKINQLAFQLSPTLRFCFDFAAYPGKLTAITGKSGAGKSTLLHLIAGFYSPTSGQILFNDESLMLHKPAQRHISFLFQEHNLFPHLDLYHNIAIGCRDKNSISSAHHQLITTIIAELELDSLVKNLPQELSGGQKQRTGFARILLQIYLGQSQILLLDEPFVALDKILRQKLIAKIKQVTDEFQLTTLLVSHHPEELGNAADDMLHLEAGRVDYAGDFAAFFANPRHQEERKLC